MPLPITATRFCLDPFGGDLAGLEAALFAGLDAMIAAVRGASS